MDWNSPRRTQKHQYGLLPSEAENASFLLRPFLQGTVATGHESNTESGGELGNHPPGQKQSRPWLVFGVKHFHAEDQDYHLYIVFSSELSQMETFLGAGLPILLLLKLGYCCCCCCCFVVKQIILKMCAFWNKFNALSPKERKLGQINKCHCDFEKYNPRCSHPRSPYLMLMQRPLLLRCCGAYGCWHSSSDGDLILMILINTEG